MLTKTTTLSNPVYQALRQITGETRVEQALSIALKDLVRLKQHELQQKINAYEQKYGLNFVEFEAACQNGNISNPHAYEVEKDNWDWESALYEQKDLETIAAWLK